MPMIDVYATDGTFPDPGSLAQRLAAMLMRIEEYSYPRKRRLRTRLRRHSSRNESRTSYLWLAGVHRQPENEQERGGDRDQARPGGDRERVRREMVGEG